MKKAFIYPTFIALAILTAGCSKQSGDQGINGQGLPESAQIGFGVTKAIQRAGEATTGDPTQLEIRDLMGETVYINNQIQQDGAAWAFVNTPKNYAWKVGDHTFFGWTAKDANGKSYTGASASGKTLTLSALTLTADNQVDFMYSNVLETTRKSTDKGDTEVPLTFQHLFAGVSFAVYNMTGSETVYHIKSFTVAGLPNKNSASISFDVETAAEEGEEDPVFTKGEAVVTPGTAAADGEFVKITDMTGEVSGTAKYDLLAGEVISSDRTYACIWPQTLPAGVTVTLVYSEDDSEEDITSAFTVPSGTVLESGKRYNFDIQFKGKGLQMNIKVLPWNEVDEAVDYANTTDNNNGVVISATALTIASGAKAGASRTNAVFAAPGTTPIQAYFSVYSPLNGQWKIRMEGDTDAFTLSSSTDGATLSTDGTYVTGPISGRIDFSVSANDATAGKQVQLYFTVVVKDATGAEHEYSLHSEVTRSFNPLTLVTE